MEKGKGGKGKEGGNGMGKIVYNDCVWDKQHNNKAPCAQYNNR